MLAANDVYLSLAFAQRDQIIGKYLFDVFPDNPDDPEADGVAKLTHSLKQVLKTKKPHIMPLQKYDVQNPKKNGKWEARYWRPENWPILDDKGNVVYIVHCVEEVTHLVDLLNEAVGKQKEQEQ